MCKFRLRMLWDLARSHVNDLLASMMISVIVDSPTTIEVFTGSNSIVDREGRVDGGITSVQGGQHCTVGLGVAKTRLDTAGILITSRARLAKYI